MNKQRILAAGAITDGGIFAAAPGVNVNQGHALIVDGYEQVLYDYLKRDFPLGVSVNSIEASGPIHIWNEQKAIPNNTIAMDPKLGIGSTTPDYAKATLDSNYNRDNWWKAVPRTYGTRIEYDYFTLKSEQRYGTFEDLTAKDYNDMIVDFTKTTANDFWNGRSTGLADTASTYKFEFTGVLKQITDISAIADGTFIANALNTKIANLQARLDYFAVPDVICMNSATYDLLVNEEEGRSTYYQNITTEILPGHSVKGFNTYLGTLPIIQTPFVKPLVGDGTNGVAVGSVKHSIVALNRSMIDRVWWFNSMPQFFELANPNMPLGNSRLLTNKMMLDFSNYILRAPHTGAHFTLTKTVTA
jgi:hypothetical protein